MKYKIGIVGYGSIARRHLINIIDVLDRRGIDFRIDVIRNRNKRSIDETQMKIINKVYTNGDIIPNDYDVIFITNPTKYHYDSVIKYAKKTKHLFIEKPVFDSYDVDITDLAFLPDTIQYVACPLRYTDVIQYVKNEINLNDVYSARVISSSYLPNWRPGIDYRDTYSAHADQGGGVSIDLIHEWDYILYLFGVPKKIANFRGTYSDLDIDSDDLSIYIGEYENMLVELHLDYFGKETIREIQLFTREDTIICDLHKSEIRYLHSNQVISFKEKRDDYQKKEIEFFFNIIEGLSENTNNINSALTTLKIAQKGILE